MDTVQPARSLRTNSADPFAIYPFRIDVSDAVLLDLHARCLVELASRPSQEFRRYRGTR
jgi:hypothetical protein